jgi:hypothetical protein
MAPDNSLRDFKIDFGLDLISRSPGQETYFKQQAQQLKNHSANFRTSRAAYNKGINDRAVN